MNITQSAPYSPAAPLTAPVAPDAADTKAMAAPATPLSPVAQMPDSAEHRALVQLLAGQLAPALGLKMDTAAGNAPSFGQETGRTGNVSTVESLLKYLNIPGQSSAESVSQWIADNDRELMANMKKALQDTLPASRNRDALQMDLEDDVKQWAGQSPKAASASAEDRLLGIVARFTAYELETMPASLRRSAAPAAISAGMPGASTLSAGAQPSQSYALTLPTIDTSLPVRTDELSIRLARDLEQLSDAAAEHHRGTTPEIRKKISELIKGIKETAAKLLAKNPQDQPAIFFRNDDDFLRTNAKPWSGWPWASNPDKTKGGLIHIDGSWNATQWPESRYAEHLRAFQGKLSTFVAQLNVPAKTVFQKYGDPLIPLVEQARVARDEMATKLTTSPSDSMALASLHQRQADFNVLAQALSSVIRNLQRIADNIINAMR